MMHNFFTGILSRSRMVDAFAYNSMGEERRPRGSVDDRCGDNLRSACPGGKTQIGMQDDAEDPRK